MLKQLRSLKVNRTSSRLLSVAAISQATALTHLVAGGDWDAERHVPQHRRVPSWHFSHLSSMQQLRSLELHICSLDSKAAAAVAQLTQLTSCGMYDSVLGLDMIAALSNCGSLVELKIRGMQCALSGVSPAPAVIAAAWAHLSRLTALETLDVTGCSSNAEFDAGLLLPLVEACGSRLRVLLLDACVKQQGELAELLPACTGLTALDLSHSSCSFSADDLSALAGLSRLAKLQLHCCKPMLRDDVVAALVQLRQLQQLDLRDNDLSLAGARALLVALAGAGGQLTELRMGGNFDVTGRAKVQLAREFVHVAL
ncbi:hypothetical protein OEZ85_010928 [Tetradesmus obliquus]|uniref:Uncharacterized protein n=1 Tax=Tetradesmus obliquus TaxID=3088 RepID=A0ABY8TPF9_TETOB|nr:hypothetical protein OEZ85_010928 [Tetradesmus obliquus]